MIDLLFCSVFFIIEQISTLNCIKFWSLQHWCIRSLVLG